jgi:hypothetical protein
MYSIRGIRSIRFLSVPLLAWLAWIAALDPVVAPGGAEARGSKAQIVISRADSVPGKAFEIVGRVREQTRVPGLTETDERLEERSSDRLAVKARELGADAVLGMHGLPAGPDAHPRWVSGVAVRLAEPTGLAAPKRASFIVSVLPIEIPDSLLTRAKERSRVADWMSDDARSELETHGYYAQRIGSATADSSALAAMPDSVWNATFGAWTDRVLCIRFGTSRTSNLVIQSRQETAVAAWMYSRAAGRVVWSSAAVGAGTNWGPRDPETGLDYWGNVFESNDVMVQKSLQNAVSRVLKGIPSPSD